MANLAAVTTSETESPHNKEASIAALQERSKHAATKADLHRVALYIVLALIGLLGSLILHLHNTMLAEMSAIRAVLNEVLLRVSGG